MPVEPKVRMGWDDTVPDDVTKELKAWRAELPEISNHSISMIQFDKKKHYLQLHSFTDAYRVDYGGVVCLCTVYQDTTTCVSMVIELSATWCLYHEKTPNFLAGSMFRPAKPSQKKRNRAGVG